MIENELRVNLLKASLRGELIQPGDEGYDAARSVYNAMIDKRPALIVRCADVADVIATVIKSTYDPTNFFRVNQNIRPSR